MLDLLARAGYRIAYRVLRVWWFIRRPDVHGAFVAVWYEGALLLIRNSYRAGETIPCGQVDRGETARAGARLRRRRYVHTGPDRRGAIRGVRAHGPVANRASVLRI